MIFLETPEDMKWLAETHCAIAANYVCAILYGNADSPSKVELFSVNHYQYKSTILIPNKDGRLYVKQWGKGAGSRIDQ